MRAPKDRILRINEAAEMLGVNRQTLYNWEAKGLMPKRTKIGPRARGYRESDLNAFIDGRAEASAA